MIPLDTLSLFFAASTALAPGPDNLFVLTQSALHGRRAGLLVTLGLCTGLLAHTAAVTLSLAAVIQTSALAFDLLKGMGAGYLPYLAWRAFHAGMISRGADLPKTGAAALYTRGIVMNVTNPKVALFFLAFLPQFADPARGPLGVQLILLGALFILSALIVFGAIAWGAGALGEWLRGSTQAQRVMNRVAGGIFLGLALRLAMAER